MHRNALAIGIGATALWFAAALPAATVYKWTDEHGVIHFSDQPTPGAQRIVTQTGAAAARFNTPPPPRISGGKRPDEPKSAVDYASFAIVAPEPEQTFNDPSVNVQIEIAPALKANQVIALILDGKVVENQSPAALDFSLTDLPRGAHTVVATVTDTNTGDTKTTPRITFYIHQTSILSPQSPQAQSPLRRIPRPAIPAR